MKRVIERKAIMELKIRMRTGPQCGALSPAALRIFRACPNPDNNSLSEKEHTHTRVFTH